MKRAEQKEKLYFIQVGEKFFDEFGVKALMRMPAGDTMLRIYMQAWSKSLATGGELTLHEGLEPANEIAILIDSPDTEVPMIAQAMQYCITFGLIKTHDDLADRVVEFLLTEDYTRAWTKDAIERRDKRRAEIEAQARLQLKDKSTNEVVDETQEAEAPAQTKTDDDIERVLDAWKRTPFAQIRKLTSKRRTLLKARIKDYGVDDVIEAIEIAAKTPFCLGKNDRGWKADFEFLLRPDSIAKILEGKYGPTTGAAAATAVTAVTPEQLTDQMIDEVILREGLTDDPAKWAKIKDGYSEAMQKAVDEALRNP